MSARKQLTAERIREALEATDYHYAEAARLLGHLPDTLRARMASLRAAGHSFKPSKAIGKQNEAYKPTRKEIRAKCLEFQKSWTPRERSMRAVMKVECVEVTRVRVDDDLSDIW